MSDIEMLDLCRFYKAFIATHSRTKLMLRNHLYVMPVSDLVEVRQQHRRTRSGRTRKHLVEVRNIVGSRKLELTLQEN